MGSKGGTSTSTVQIPPEVLARYNAVNANAENVAKTPFQQYGGQFVAPLTSTQQAGIANTNAAANQAQPYFGAATSAATNAYQGAQPYQGAATALAAGSTQQVNAQPLDIGTYLSPYLNTVLGSTASLLNQNNQQQQAGQLGNAIRSGAFGGDRAGIAAANLAQQQNLGNAKIYSDIANQGFNTALGAAQQQQGVNLGASQANRAALLSGSNALAGIGQQGYAQGMGLSQQLAGLGTGAQGAALQGAQAQLGAGQAEQQTQQAQNTALYNQFLQEKSYPFQVAQFLANIAEGTGSLSGSTTTTNSVQNGIFSDRRLKTDIKPIGKTYDGQTIYSYRYKGEKHTEIGLIAQEVEKKHPHAVGLAGGHKTVDYGHATDHAARKGHFAAGGGVSPMSAGEGFYTGGLASGYDPAMMAQLMANYQAMYGPLLSHSALGGVNGGSIVPTANVPVSQLHPAEAAPIRGQDLAQNVNNWASAGTALGKLGDKLHVWKFGDKSGGLGSVGEAAKAAANDVEDSLLDSVGDYAHGGLARADGGAIPYLSDEGNPLNIPNDQHRYELLKPNNGNDGSGGGGDLIGGIGKVAGTALSVAKLGSMLSDERAKENIHAIGETFDGQKVYRYNYKGDDTPRMGLLAQEVEKHHPGAVGEARGLKTVDYAKATSKAAKRGKFADGGGIDNPILDSLMKKLRPWEHDGPKEPDWDNDGQPGETPSDEDHVVSPVKTKRPSDVGFDGDSLDAVAAPARIAPAGAEADDSPKGLEGIAARIAKAEGSGKNPRSSATGPFQFLNGTFRQYVGKVDPDMAQQIAGMNDKQLSAFRAGNPAVEEVEKQMGLHLTADNASILAKAGIEPDAPSVYLAHVLGPKGAVAVLSADPDTPLVDLERRGALTRGTLANNPIGSTAADALEWASRRMAGKRGGFASGGMPGDDDAVAAKFGDDAAATSDDDLDASLAQRVAAMRREALPPSVDRALRVAAPQPANDASSQAPIPEWASADVTPKHGFFKGLAHGDASSILPLLSGIGALATTQTDNPLTALAAALGAGAQAAQGQRQFALEQRKTEAERLAAQTGFQALPFQATRAKAEYQSAVNGQIGQMMSWLQTYQPLANALSASGHPDENLNAMIADMNSRIKGFAQTPGLAPAASSPGAPVAPNFGSVDFTNPADLQKVGASLAMAGAPGGATLTGLAAGMRQSGTRLTPSGSIENIPGAVPSAVRPQVALDTASASTKARDEANAAARAAQYTLGYAREFENMLVDDKGKPRTLGGPLEKVRAGIGSWLSSTGLVSDGLAAQITGTDPANYQAMQKLRTNLAAAAGRGELGPAIANHPGEFNTWLRSVPNADLLSAVSLKLLRQNIIPQAQQAIDASLYANTLDPATDYIPGKLTDWRQQHSWFKPKPTPAAAPAAAPRIPQQRGVYQPTSPAQISMLPAGAKFRFPKGAKGRNGEDLSGQIGTVPGRGG